MFNDIVDIEDGCFRHLKDNAYRLSYDGFQFMLYPTYPGWVVIQTKGNPIITLLTEINPDTGTWRFRYGEPNSIVNEIIEMIQGYRHSLENATEEDDW